MDNPLKYYAGIGSRETPVAILHRLTAAAANLLKAGWILRSGGADGADTAFENGAADKKRIYIPWAGFNERKDGIVIESYIDNYYLGAIAEKHHPNWQACSPAAKKLHTRNVAQVLGHTGELVDSRFVLCWTKGGKGGGGSGQAIRDAKEYGIPVYDFAKDRGEADFYERWLAEGAT